MKPIGPNFRRFISPTDPGSVVVKSPRTRRERKARADDTGKPMVVSSEKPEGDWLRRRTLHHYPHEAHALVMGKVAFAMVCGIGVAVLLAMFDLAPFLRDWLGIVIFFGMIGSHLLGVFSQILSGGRCWHGAAAMAGAWIFLFLYFLSGV